MRYHVLLIISSFILLQLYCSDNLWKFLEKQIDAPTQPAVTPNTSTLPDTGQITCASGPLGTSAMAACAGVIITGQDGHYANSPNTWALSVTDSGNTITDSTSDLVWQRCTGGQSTTTCTGPANLDTQTASNTYCSGLALAGKTWRLPSIRELSMFPNYNYTDPAADDNDSNNFFPNQPGNGANALFWTATTYMPTPANFWAIDMQVGLAVGLPPPALSYVRCVSGPSLTANNLTDKGDGTVLESNSELVFTKCPNDTVGIPVSGVLCTVGLPIGVNWLPALNDCETLIFAGRTDWRLPSIRELANILKYDEIGSPYIDSLFFPGTPGSFFWTSTSFVSNTTQAWLVATSNGTTLPNSKAAGTGFVRCVAPGP